MSCAFRAYHEMEKLVETLQIWKEPFTEGELKKMLLSCILKMRNQANIYDPKTGMAKQREMQETEAGTSSISLSLCQTVLRLQ